MWKLRNAVPDREQTLIASGGKPARKVHAMSLRDLATGSGCAPDAGASSSNPLVRPLSSPERVLIAPGAAAPPRTPCSVSHQHSKPRVPSCSHLIRVLLPSAEVPPNPILSSRRCSHLAHHAGQVRGRHPRRRTEVQRWPAARPPQWVAQTLFSLSSPTACCTTNSVEENQQPIRPTSRP